MKTFRDLLVRGGDSVAAIRNIKTRLAVDKFKVDKGLVKWVGIYFPKGCSGMVYARMFFQTHQILPRDQHEWTHGDGGWWGGDVYVPVTAAPLGIKVEAYEDDCDFDHTIQIGVEITPWNMVARHEEQAKYMRLFVQSLGVPIPKEEPSEFKP